MDQEVLVDQVGQVDQGDLEAKHLLVVLDSLVVQMVRVDLEGLVALEVLEGQVDQMGH